MECPRCSGSGVCKECDGQGFQECPVCSGAGQRKTPRGGTYNCKGCEGTGKVDCPKECSSCAGTGQITEQLQQDQLNKYKMRFANLTPNNKVVVPILVVNLLCFGAFRFLDGNIMGRFVISDSMFAEGNWWALITASFLHYDPIHIACNLAFLWFYGPPLEGVLGKAKFMAFYLFSAITAGGVSWLGHHLTGMDNYWAYGASGPMFGIIGAMAALYWRWSAFAWPRVYRLLQVGGAILVLGFLLRGHGVFILSHLDNWAHLGGLAGGFLIAATFPRPTGR